MKAALPLGFLSVAPAAVADQCETEAKACELVISQAELLAGLASAPVRRVVVTGASSGVGLAGAKLLTAAGHQVTLACRTQAKADEAAAACMQYAASASAVGPAGKPSFYSVRRAGGTARGAECDLASLASIRAFAKAEAGPLDALVLNAGLSLNVGDTEERFTADGFEREHCRVPRPAARAPPHPTLSTEPDRTDHALGSRSAVTVGTNHLGHFALAGLLQPALAKSAAPRLLVTASGVHDPTSGGGKQGGPDKWASLGDLAGLAGGSRFSMVDGGAYDPDKAYKDSKLCNMLVRGAQPPARRLPRARQPSEPPPRQRAEPPPREGTDRLCLLPLDCPGNPPPSLCSSPLGLHASQFMAEAARRFDGKVTVNAFSPGLIADPKGFFRNQNPTFASAFNGISKAVGVAETNDFAGSALAYLAVDPAMEGRTGGWYDALPLGKHSLAKHAPSTEAMDVAKQKRLWELSEKLVA